MCEGTWTECHLKVERARENTKGGVGQYVVTGAAKATQVIRAETVWAHFIAEKNLPFAICDVFTRMASHMFPDSYKHAHYKISLVGIVVF